jgi:hypothetical protein
MKKRGSFDPHFNNVIRHILKRYTNASNAFPPKELIKSRFRQVSWLNINLNSSAFPETQWHE